MSATTIKAGLSPKGSTSKTWFQAKLEDKEISQRQAAEFLGLDPSAVSNMLSGKRRIRLEEAAGWSRLLNEPMEMVLKMAGIPVPTVGHNPVPIVGWVDDAGEVKLEVKTLRGSALEASRPPGLGSGAVALRILGTGVSAGWTVFYVPGRKNDRVDPGAVGRWSVVATETGAVWLRVLERDPLDPDAWALRPLVGAKPLVRGARVDWAAPVVWVKG